MTNITKSLKANNVLRVISSRRGGTFMSLYLRSNLKNNLCAAWKKQDILVEKEVKMTIRCNVKYTNISSVKQRIKIREEQNIPTRQVAEWYDWVIPNLIKQHKTNGTLYLHYATVPNTRAKVKYFVNGVETPIEEVKNNGYMVNSYWKDNVAEVMDCKIDNIISINGKRV